MATTICPHCGTANRSGSNFCNRCGTDLSDQRPETPPPAETPPSISRAARRAAEQLAAGQPNPEQVPGEQPEIEQGTPLASDSSEHAAPVIEPADIEDDDGRASADLPLFDLGLASPDAQQRSQTQSGKTHQPSAGADDHPRPLVAGVRGLLEPATLGSGAPVATDVRDARLPIDADSQRWMQQLMRGEPLVAADSLRHDSRRLLLPAIPSVRVPWIFGLLFLSVLLPIAFAWRGPTGRPQLWTGVRGAYDAVERLSADADVMIFWAYDPATAGEMDLVAEPVLQHLIVRQTDLAFVSQRPLGPATAHRLVADTLEKAKLTGDPVRAARRITAFNVYLPGGSAVLPLLAQDSVTPLDGGRSGAALRSEMARPRFQRPDLAVVIAADAEDVQRWLEMVQAINGVETIALTGAGADPIVRPYLDSRQLRGLVSGFDGAYHYRQLMDRPLTGAEEVQQQTQIVAQNWGQLAFLAVLLIGNLIGLFFREGENNP